MSSDFNRHVFAQQAPGEQIKALMHALGGKVIRYYPRLTDLLGSMPSALFTSQLLYYANAERAKSPLIEISKSREDWQRDTWLTRRYQESAVELLCDLGMLQIVHTGGRGRPPLMRVNLTELMTRLCNLLQRNMPGAGSQGDLLVQLLGGHKAFNRALAEIADSLTGGLMLSYLIGLARIQSLRGTPPLWMENPIDTIQIELRLTRRQIAHAREQMIGLGLIHESTTNQAPPRLRIMLVYARIAERAVELGCAAPYLLLVGDSEGDEAVEASSIAPSFPIITPVNAPVSMPPSTLALSTALPTALTYPAGLTERERASIEFLLQRISADLAQDMLDEMAAGYRSPKGINNPVGYVRAMIARAGNGEFTRERCLKIQDARLRRVQMEEEQRARMAAREAEAARWRDPAFIEENQRAAQHALMTLRQSRGAA